jgi:hypothetical protein
MSLRFAITVSVVCGLPTWASAPVSTSAAQFGGLPLRFEANAGQWNRAVRYSARTGAYQLFFTPREVVLTHEGRTLGMSLVRSNPSPVIEGTDRFAGNTNYFIGPRSQWRTAVPQFSRVRYAAVYPGIDVVYYGNGSQLEYDFVLRPQADPGRIRMKFSGAQRLTLTPGGDLLVESDGSSLVQKKPLIYQQEPGSKARREIAGRYRLLGHNMVGVELARYDRTQQLTIDPVLSYSSLIGGSGNDAVTCLQVDKSGLLYLAGYVSNNDLQGNDSSFQAASKGGTDGFLAIVNPKASGGDSLTYFSYIGGDGSDQINAMALDGIGNVYLAGSTTSNYFPLGGINVQGSLQGGTDAFVVKFNPALGANALLYGTYLGGSDTDVAYGIAVDGTGKIYVAGTTLSTNFPVTASAYAGVMYGPQDAFLAKIDPDAGSLVYSTYFGGELDEDGRGLVVSRSGTVYLAGSTDSTQLPQAGNQYNSSFQGGADIFVAVFDLNQFGVGSLVYSSYIGGSDLEELRGIALDPAGKLLLTGYTLSGDFPVTGGAYRRTGGGNGDAFLVKFDPSAPPASALVYSTYLGGSGGEVAYGITSDSAGAVWITGYTLSSNFPVTTDALQSTNPGGIEVFVSKFDPTQSGDASLVYSTYLGAIGVHVGYALVLDADGNAYVGGLTGPHNITTTGSAFQNGYGGGLSDGFVVVLRQQ